MDPISLENQTLLAALESGDFQTSLPLLPKDGPPITIGPEGFTPLHYACRHGDAEVARLLITQYKYSIKSPSKHGHTPVHVAAQYGHTDTLRALAECSLASEPEKEECSSSYDDCTPQDGVTNRSLPTANASDELQLVNILTCTNVYGKSPLHLAAQNGHLEVVKYLVDEEGCPTSPTDEQGRTPLYLAAGSGHLEVVKYFTEVKQCDPNTVTTEQQVTIDGSVAPGRTPLHASSQGGHLDVVHWLVSSLNCDLLCRDEDGVTPLQLAPDNVRLFLPLESGDFQTALPLLPKDGPPITIGPEGFTPLHYACRHGEAEVARLLITQYKYSIKSPSKHGHTPVHVAAQYGHTDTLRALAECACVSEPPIEECNSSSDNATPQVGGISTSQPPADSPDKPQLRNILACNNLNGETPLHLAAQSGHLEVVMDEVGCPTSPTDEHGRTPLYLAAGSGQLEVVRYFIEKKKCDPSTGMTKPSGCSFASGRTPLHAASQGGHLDVVYYLVNSLTCDPQCRDEDGVTPLQLAPDNMKLFLALESGDFQTALPLLPKDGPPITIGPEGFTPLHYACRHGEAEVARLLITQYKYSIKSPSKHGHTPVHVAAQYGHADTLRALAECSLASEPEKEECITSIQPLCSSSEHYTSQDVAANTSLHTVDSPSQLQVMNILTCENQHEETPLHLAAQKGNLNVVNAPGATPLHTASREGHLDVVRYLVNVLNCDPMCRDEDGITPLHLAAGVGHLAVVQFLVESGCDPMVKEVGGITPLHLASLRGHLDTVKYLTRYDRVDPSCRDKDGVTPLLMAAMNGHLPIVQFLVETGCDPMVREANSRTPLHYASQDGHLDTVKYLVRFDQADPSCRDKNGITPLLLAAIAGNLPVVQFLVESGCDPTIKGMSGETPLHLASLTGNLDTVRYLVSTDQVDPSCQADGGVSPLHLAAQNGHLPVVQFLVESGCDPMVRKVGGSTPLHYASLNGHLDIVVYLTSNDKVDPSCRDEKGFSPLLVAAENGHLPVVQFLVESGCDPMTRKVDGVTPIHSASLNGHLDTVKYFASNERVDPSCKDENGVTPLLMAAVNGHLPIVQFLVDTGCDPMVREANSRTPLHYASQNGHLDTVKYLVSFDQADPSCRDKNGITPLLLAAIAGNLPVVQFLVESGCDPTIKGMSGETPLHLASLTGNLDTVRYLVSTDQVDPSCQADGGVSPLHLAAQNGHLPVVQFLVESGCDPTARELNSRTPLHYASQNGHLNTVKYLASIDQVDPSCQDKDGITPLFLAAVAGHLPVLQFLVEIGCNPITASVNGKTLLHFASQSGHLDIVRYLASDNRVNLSCQDDNGVTPLLLAAGNGHLPVVQFLVETGCDPMTSEVDGRTPLHYASQNGHLDTVKYLTSTNRVDSSCQDKDGITPLFLAVIAGSLPVVKVLVEAGCDPMIRVVGGSTLLHYASLNGHLDIVMYLTSDDQVEHSCQDEKGFSPLHLAARNGHLPVVQFLTETGCDPNIRMVDGRTPLHFASLNGHLDTVKYFTSNEHVDPSCIDVNGVTPLHLAAANGHLPVVQFLTDTGCDPMVRMVDGRTPLHFASWTGHLETVKYLVNTNRVDPWCQDKDGISPLFLAAMAGHLSVLQFLVESGCDPIVKNVGGSTPLHYASLNGHIDIVMYLTSNDKVDPSCQDEKGFSPLLLAAQNGHLSVVQFLVEVGCDPMVRMGNGRTPLHRASQNGHLDTVKYLTSCKQVDPGIKSHDGVTPLYLAATHGHLEVVRHLVRDKYCDPSLSFYGETPIEAAKSNGHWNVVLYLHSKGETIPSPNPSVSSSLQPFGHLSPQVKVYVVGNRSSGKSSLVKALSTKGSWLGNIRNVKGVIPETAGIVSSDFDSERYGKITFYDFAGHSEYYASHELVFQNTSYPVVLVVVDLSKDHNSIDIDVRFWRLLLLNWLSAADSQAYAIVIGSHSDTLDSRSLSSKSVLLEQFAPSSTLNVLGYTVLDCRKSASAGMTQLHELLRTGCKMVRMQIEFDYENGRILNFFLIEHMSGTVACTIRELLDTLIENEDLELEPLKAPALLYQVCESLNTSGHLLLLKNKETPEKSWLVLKQGTILSTVNGLLKHIKQFATLGIASLSLLRNELKQHAPDVPPNLAVAYMKNMLFCSEVDPQALALIADYNPVSLQESVEEQHMFFPSLLDNEKPAQVWEWSPTEHYTYVCGWHLKCTDPDHFFTPRFLQSLQLELACRFALQISPSSPGHGRLEPQRGCRLWLNGIRWIRNGIEVVMHVGSESKLLGLMLRCIKEREMECIHLRSTLLEVAFSIKDKVSKGIQVTEYLLHPHCVRTFPVPDVANVPLSQVASAIVRKEATVNLDDTGLTDIPGYPFLLLQDLLFYEPYQDIGVELLHELFQNSSEVISQMTLDKLAAVFCKRLSSTAIILRTPLVVLAAIEAEDKSDFHKCCSILSEWSHREGTYSALRRDLGQYSIFCGRNPLDIAGIRVPLPFVATDIAEQCVLMDNISEDQRARLHEIPKLRQLQCLYPKGEPSQRAVRVMDEVSPKWDSLALSLRFEEHEIETIARDNPSDCKGACRVMFGQWLDGNHRQPVTWETLIKCLYETDTCFKSLSDKLLMTLCGPPSTPPSDVQVEDGSDPSTKEDGTAEGNQLD